MNFQYLVILLVQFTEALRREKEGSLLIVPVIIDPCDWLNTPFKEFRVLPPDGKAVSTWSNINTAFLDITQGLRNVITGKKAEVKQPNAPAITTPLSRNYPVKRSLILSIAPLLIICSVS